MNSIEKHKDNKKNLSRVARNRRRKIIASQFNIENKINFIKAPRIKIFIILVVIIMVLGFIFINIKSNNQFKVKNIQILSENSSNIDNLKNYLIKYRNINILNIDSNKIKKDILGQFPSFQNVFINKDLQGDLNIEIVQEVPVYYLVNLTGIYTLNQNGKVISKLTFDKLNLNETELTIINNSVDSNSDYFKNLYISKITNPDDQIKVKWEEVPVNEKNNLVKIFSDELNSKITNYFNSAQNEIKKQNLDNLTGCYKKEIAVYNLNDLFNKNDLNFLSKVEDFFYTKKYQFLRSEWQTDYTLEIRMLDNKLILFSIKREVQDQFKDLQTIIDYGKFEKAKVIDVRSVNYSINF